MSKVSPAIALLQRMVRVPSVSGEEQALGDELFDLARSWKLDAQRLPFPGHADQLLITVDATVRDAPRVLLDSHLDTVATEGMTIDPFDGAVKDGKVHGRGACDTKGTGAAMLQALREYAALPERPNHAAVLMCVEEETDMCGVRRFVEHDMQAIGWRPDAAIVGEPTIFHPVIAHNGLVRWRITAHGVAAHSSTPHEGRSAITAMVKAIAAIERDYIPGVTATDPLTGSAACSINTIHGGSAVNIIPDRCTIDVDRRLVPGEDADAQCAALDRVLESLGETLDREDTVRHPPLTTRHNGELVRRTVAILGDMGLPRMTLGAPFATHAAYFDAAAIPCLVIGPGDAHKAHTKDEFVEVAQIERGVELYGRLLGGGQPPR